MYWRRGSTTPAVYIGRRKLNTSNQRFRACGTNVTIYGTSKILSPERVIIGETVIIDDFVFIGSHERLVIGNYVHIASHASITGGGECLVCDFCGISSGARLLTGTDDFKGEGLTGPTIPAAYRRVTRTRTLLEPHVVVGANAVVLPGLRIGEGTVVGAGAVVTKNLDPWGVYAGQPARRIGERHKDTIIALRQAMFKQHGSPDPSFTDTSALDWV